MIVWQNASLKLIKNDLVKTRRLKSLGKQCWSLVGAVSLALSAVALPAIAAPRQYISTISAYGESQSYNELVRRAEAQAQRMVSSAFANNPSLTEVSVTILGQRNNQEVPLLVTTVSRNSWRRSPNIRTWAQYSGYSAKVLLGYVQPTQSPLPTATQPATQPGVAPSTVTTPSTPGITPIPGGVVITSPAPSLNSPNSPNAPNSPQTPNPLSNSPNSPNSPQTPNPLSNSPNRPNSSPTSNPSSNSPNRPNSQRTPNPLSNSPNRPNSLQTPGSTTTPQVTPAPTTLTEPPQSIQDVPGYRDD